MWDITAGGTRPDGWARVADTALRTSGASVEVVAASDNRAVSGPNASVTQSALAGSLACFHSSAWCWRP